MSVIKKSSIQQYLALFMRLILSVILLTALSSCGSAQPKPPPPPPVLMPCILPGTLLHNAIGRLGINIIKIQDVYRIIIPVDTVFETRSADIKIQAQAGLSQLGRYLQKFLPARMTVIGYTDSLSRVREDELLSENRARSLITYLWTQGIPRECLVPLGIGKDEDYTIASNRSVNGSAANRRIEINFKAKSRYALK